MSFNLLKVLEVESTSGVETVWTYEGPSQDLAAFLATLPTGWSDLRRSTEIYSTPDGGTSYNGVTQIEVRYATESASGTPGGGAREDGLVLRKWTMPYANDEIPLAQGETMASLALVHPAWPEEILRAAEYWRKFRDTSADGTWTTDLTSYNPKLGVAYGGTVPTGASPNTAQLNLCQAIFDLLKQDAGATTTVSAPNLQLVEILTNKTTLIASQSNLNRLHTFSTLLSAYNADPGKLATAPLVNQSDCANWVWLKTAPIVDESPGGLYQLTQVYKGLKESPFTLARYGAPL